MADLCYIGTRNNEIREKASVAILKGICEDGGLFVPEKIPALHQSLDALSKLSYQDLAFEIMRLYFTDFTEAELKYCITKAYDEKFRVPIIAPLTIHGDAMFLELFHGKTLAFKDMALSILPHLMKTAAKKNGLDKEIVILAATSGDTGKAALEGFAHVPGTRIIVFFPEDGVSPVQKLQMVTQEGENTCVVGIRGNFDDAQSAVKKMFTDKALEKELEEKGFCFSSANSINIGRLIPQIVYYFYAYFQAVNQEEIALGDKCNVSVPTGNFGNILAGFYAKEMGLPIGHFICASNDNKVLYDFFQTGIYDKNRLFQVTISPSMDILISSNLERLVYFMKGAEKTKDCMEALANGGKYEMELTNCPISGEFATEEETKEAINKLYQATGYVIDPHTAVAYVAYQKYKKKTGDDTPTVVISTASPYKFTEDVMSAIHGKKEEKDVFALMEELQEVSGRRIPQPIFGIHQRPILHSNVCDKEELQAFVKNYLFHK